MTIDACGLIPDPRPEDLNAVPDPTTPGEPLVAVRVPGIEPLESQKPEGYAAEGDCTCK